LLGISLVIGRLVTGLLLDRLPAARVGIGMIGLSAVGFLIISVLGPSAVPFAALLVGLSLGAEVDLLSFMTSRYVSYERYGRVIGLLYATFLFGVATSPLIYAGIRQFSGSYAWAFLWSAAALIAACVGLTALPPLPKPQPAGG
jgi:predicted MFS family arabinose efflux permease